MPRRSLAASCAALLLAAGCSLVIDPTRYDLCTDSHQPTCDGAELVVCAGDLDQVTACAAGCDPERGACIVATCGNGRIDDGEVCDDGNAESGDGCRADCGKVEECGDAVVDFGEPCDDGNTNDGDGCDCRSPDLLINTTYPAKQKDPSIAISPDGPGLIAWTDESQAAPDTSGTAVHGRLISADRRFVGADFPLNLTTAFDQSDPAVAASTAGGAFLVAWEDDSHAEGDTSGKAIRGRVFDLAGAPQTGDFVVNSTTGGDQDNVAIAAMPDGGYLLVWDDRSASTADADIRMRRFDADGIPAGDDELVNTTLTGDQTHPRLAVGAGGDVLVAWEDASQEGSDQSGIGIRGRRLAASGAFLDTDFVLNTTTLNDQLEPHVVALSGGGYLVVFTDTSGAPSDQSDVRIRLIPGSGDPVDDDLPLATTLEGPQDEPFPVALPGAVVLFWTDESMLAPDTSGTAVRMRVLSADGVPGAPDEVVNAIYPDNQETVGAVALDATTILAAWEDKSLTPPDSSGAAVRGRFIDVPEGAAALERPR